MTITIDIAPETEEKLQERARKSGADVAEYVKGLIDKDLTTPSLDEILRPLREEFQVSGMTEEELDTLVDEAREEVWQERQKTRRKVS